MSEWPSVALEEIAAPDKNAIAIGPFGSRMKKDLYVEAGVPVIRGTNITGSREFQGDFVYVSESTADELGRANVFGGDLVFPHRGAIGEVGIVPSRNQRYMLSTSLMKFSCDREQADPLFLYYFFRSAEGRYELLKNASQVGTPGIARPLESLRSVRLKLPPLSAQQSIAHILGTLDDKIELNRRMNRTLEAIARAMFKSWFIDFDPVHAKAEGREPVGMDPETAALFPDSFQDSPLGKIPKGWEVTTLDKVADVVDCLHSKKPAPRDSGQLLLQVYNVGRNGELDLSQPFWINEDEYREWTRRIELGSGDLVITKTGRVGAVAQIPFGVKAGLGRNMVGIRSRPSISTPRFMRCLLTSDWMQREIDRMTSDGTILRSLHVKAIEKLRLALPPYRLLKRFEDVCHPVLCLAETNTAEVAELAQTRDALLPRLLSGRLPVGAIGYAGTDD